MYAPNHGLGQIPVLTAAEAATGILGIRIGGHYTCGPFNPDGLQNWANQGHWDYIQQVASTGHGPHWSQPDKYPNGISYAPVDQQAAQRFLLLKPPAPPTAPVAAGGGATGLPPIVPGVVAPAPGGVTPPGVQNNEEPGTAPKTLLQSAGISSTTALVGAAVVVAGIFAVALKGRR